MKTKLKTTLAPLVVFSVSVVCLVMSALAINAPAKACDVKEKDVITVEVTNPSFYCRHDDSLSSIGKESLKGAVSGSIGALIGGVVTFLVTWESKKKEMKAKHKERMYVALTSAIAYFDAYIGDVNQGLETITGKLAGGLSYAVMPSASWKTYELPTDVVAAILESINGFKDTGELQAKEFMRHTKNYFVNICTNVDHVDELSRQMNKGRKDLLMSFKHMTEEVRVMLNNIKDCMQEKIKVYS